MANWQTFSKLSALVTKHYKATIQKTFENLRLLSGANIKKKKPRALAFEKKKRKKICAYLAALTS